MIFGCLIEYLHSMCVQMQGRVVSVEVLVFLRGCNVGEVEKDFLEC